MPARATLLLRSPLIVAGLLLLTIGLVNTLVGSSKITEYRTVRHAAAPVRPSEPRALFPRASEAEQRRALAEAKLVYYELYLRAGQLLAALGVALVGVGLLRGRGRVLPPAASSLSSR